ncbi:MAG: hypothetical protein ABL888_15775, partial [Pirellulaceae bacterium]
RSNCVTRGMIKSPIRKSTSLNQPSIMPLVYAYDLGSAQFAAIKNPKSSFVHLANGARATFSRIKEAVTAAGNQVKVSLYSRGFGRRIALFPDSVSPHQLQGHFKAKGYASQTPNGKPWDQLSEAEKNAMRDQDVAAVKAELDKKLGPGNWSSADPDSGKIRINGVDYTIHHHHKKGYFQLVESKVHAEVGHIGMAYWHGG